MNGSSKSERGIREELPVTRSSLTRIRLRARGIRTPPRGRGCTPAGGVTRGIEGKLVLIFGIHRNLLLPGARLPRKPHHRLQLQDILFPDLTLILFAELLGQLDATVDVLRANVVGGDLDRVGKIGNLGWKVSIERRVGRIRLEKRT